MAEHLTVDLVAADRTVWSGEARMVIARTVEGDLGVLRGHSPMLSLLADAVVEIDAVDGERVVAVVDGGFLSVADDRVSILSEYALLADEIDADAARAQLEAGSAEGEAPEDDERRVRRAEARLRAVERAR